jgi:uncharacterized protein YbcI
VVELAHNIRDFVIGRYRSACGKGPRDVYVKMTKNMVVLRIQGVLTPMERYVLAQDQESISLVQPLREKMFSLMLPDIITTIERTTNNKVVQVCSELIWQRDERYCLVILDQDVLNQ